MSKWDDRVFVAVMAILAAVAICVAFERMTCSVQIRSDSPDAGAP